MTIGLEMREKNSIFEISERTKKCDTHTNIQKNGIFNPSIL